LLYLKGPTSKGGEGRRVGEERMEGKGGNESVVESKKSLKTP